MKALARLLPAFALAACVETLPPPAPGGPVQPPEPAAGLLMRLGASDLRADALPDGWTVAETHSAGKPATWAAREVRGGRLALHVASENAGSTFNLLLSPEPFPADLELVVRVRAGSGVEDQGGGLVWRAQGPRDYYVARWNPLERNVCVYKVEDGVRSLLQCAEGVEVAPEEWHTLGVVMIGDHLTVSLDGVTYLDTHDATFAGPGRVGLWTKADASSWFEDLEVWSPRWPEER